MKRAMTLIVVMSVLLFSQLALAEWEFQPGTLVAIRGGEAQDQGNTDQELAAAAGFRIVPLQVWTHPTMNIDEHAQPWWNLEQDYYATVALRVYGSGSFSSSLTVTDVKTGKSIKFRYGPESITEGDYWLTYGPDSVSGDPSRLPRTFSLKYSYKVGTVVKSITTKIMLIE
jgi:hypothetical protein